jgi:hypothetical protein
MKITEKMVLPVLDVITLNIMNLENREYVWCKKTVASITDYLGRNRFITQAQWDILLKIKRQVLSKSKINLVASKY